MISIVMIRLDRILDLIVLLNLILKHTLNPGTIVGPKIDPVLTPGLSEQRLNWLLTLALKDAVQKNSLYIYYIQMSKFTRPKWHFFYQP